MNIVLRVSSTGRPAGMNVRDGSVEPTPTSSTRRRQGDERLWKGAGNGVVFFHTQARSLWAARARQLGVALLAIATIVGLVLLTLAVAYARQ
jgi:hypothetical protein